MADANKMREALERAERKLAAYVGVCKGDKELTDVVLPMVRAALAERPAQGAPELDGLMESDFTTALEAQAWRSGFKAGNMKQPAQGEVVAEFRKNRSGSYLHWFINESSLPSSTVLYAAPPAPSVPDVPDGWRLESKRLIPLLQSFADRLANNSKSGAHHPELYEADHDTLLEAIRHLKQTAAPIASGGKASVPDGWKLVPERLTPHMGHAGDATLDDDGSMQEMWTNMLAAAPEPPR